MPLSKALCGKSNKDVDLNIVFLADLPELLPEVAQWYFDEWGHFLEDPSTNSFIPRLQGCLNKDSFPLVILALKNGELLGAAQIKLHQMSIYPDKEHWLAGVYVKPTHRGKNISSALLNELDSIAIKLGVKKLHLQTEHLNGGLYSRFGWQPEEVVNYRNTDVMVMSKNLVT